MLESGFSQCLLEDIGLSAHHSSVTVGVDGERHFKDLLNHNVPIYVQECVSQSDRFSKDTVHNDGLIICLFVQFLLIGLPLLSLARKTLANRNIVVVLCSVLVSLFSSPGGRPNGNEILSFLYHFFALQFTLWFLVVIPVRHIIPTATKFAKSLFLWKNFTRRWIVKRGRSYLVRKERERLKKARQLDIGLWQKWKPQSLKLQSKQVSVLKFM